MPWRFFTRLLLLLALQLAVCGAAAGAEPGKYQRITSRHLGYDLQYRVYVPEGVVAGDELASLYVTDGQWYLEPGGFRQILDETIESAMVTPIVVVFLDSINPDDPADNRRNREFMCNQKYAAFFADELIPAINTGYPVKPSREQRVILGVSFGGLNAACFGVMSPDLFAGIAMQSPARGAHVDVVRELYEKSPKLPLKMFLSVGTKNDNLAAANRFRKTLLDKDYDLTYRKVREGHDWNNWRPLLDDVLLTFFAKPAGGQ